MSGQEKLLIIMDMLLAAQMFTAETINVLFIEYFVILIINTVIYQCI